MFALALLLLAVAPAQVIFEGDLVVPRSRARGIPVKVEHPTYIHGTYKTANEGSQVRAALMTAADVKAYQDGRGHDMLAVTEYASSGEFRLLVMRPGAYFMLVDNRLDTQASQTVHARLTGAEDPSLPHTLPAGRRQAIVATSLLMFGMVAGWSGWRLRGVRLFRS